MVYRKPSNPPPPRLKPPTFQQPVGHLITQDVNSWKWILYMIILWHVKSVVHLFSAPFLLLQNCLAQKFHKTLDACVVNQKYSATRSPRASSSGAPGDTRGWGGRACSRATRSGGYCVWNPINETLTSCLIDYQKNYENMFFTREAGGWGGGRFED